MNRLFREDRTVDTLKLGPNTGVNEPYFVMACLVGLACLALDMYLAVRHWRALSDGGVLLLAIPIGAQIVFQIWRLFAFHKVIHLLMNDQLIKGTETQYAKPSTLASAYSTVGRMICWSFVIDLLLLLFVHFALNR